jgi:hypothetical protein
MAYMRKYPAKCPVCGEYAEPVFPDSNPYYGTAINRDNPNVDVKCWRCNRCNLFFAERGLICPECGGELHYWREYLTTKSQKINADGTLGKIPKTVSGQISDMEGFECQQCKFIFNVINDVEGYTKYPHLIKWMKKHSELKV